MFAIVEIGGKQVKVVKDQKVYVNRLDGKEGSKVTFDNVLLLENAGKIVLGTPTVNGAGVEAKIVKHLKDDKVIVFKKKRRKGYKVKNGHRQLLTELVIEKIIEKGAKVKSSIQNLKPGDEQAVVKKAAVKKAAVKKPAVKKTPAKKPAVKKAVAKKPAVKKAVAKKTTVKKSATKKNN
jgi:large subunit ribosomal protein L21